VFYKRFRINNCIKVLLSWNSDATNHVLYEVVLFDSRVM